MVPRVASVRGAVALLPVDPVLQDAPVAHARHAGVGHGGATPDHHAPPTVPCEEKTIVETYYISVLIMVKKACSGK